MRMIDADEVLARIENPYQRAEIARWLRDAPTIERKTGEWLHDLLQDAIDDGIITEAQAVRIMERVNK